jgi:hypothetical protein
MQCNNDEQALEPPGRVARLEAKIHAERIHCANRSPASAESAMLVCGMFPFL